MTGAGAILGTLQYMAPEQIEGRPADARADIFAFGALLFEMLTGRRAFEESSPPALADGAYLVGNYSLSGAWNLFVLPLRERAPAEPLLRSSASHNDPVVSPNARFVAYQSFASGRPEVYVRPFPSVNDGRWRVSSAGSSHPVWARNGRELFFLDASSRLTSVSVDTTRTAFHADVPVRLLTASYYSDEGPIPYDISPDGARFLMIKEDPKVRAPNTRS